MPASHPIDQRKPVSLNRLNSSVLFTLALCFFCSQSYATSIVLNIIDGPGEGLNDTSPAAPIGGNNGTTVGEQRTIVFEYAAALLEQIVNSNVPIVIDTSFDPLTPCSSSSGVIGQAGAIGWERNTPGLPLVNTWYPNALANSLAGSDQSAANDISMTFNSDVDNNNSCLNNKNFYYGLDGNPGSDIDFLTTVLHEMIHGLGFQTIVDLETGQKFAGFNDTYMRNLEDHSLDDNWSDLSMSNAERVASAIDDPDLHWTGANVDANQGVLSAGTNQGHVRMHAPASLALGSSVSHFSTAASPFELMEPVIQGPVENIGLARYLLQDIGWSVTSTQNPIASEVMDIAIHNAAPTSINFAVMDNDTSPSSLTVTASSSNTSVIDNGNLILSGSGRMRQLDITPTTGTSGNVSITLTVDDGTNNNATDFTVDVTSNLPPTVTINSPADGAVFYSSPQSFSAMANDPEQGDISSAIIWSSSIDGSLPTGPGINPILSEGIHQITASITDSDTNNNTQVINITVDLNGDADSDGLSNQLEVMLGSDPEDSDSDDDLLSDFDEVNRDGDPNNYTPGLDTDPNNPDTDGDGIPDGSDPEPIGPMTVTMAPLWALALTGLLLTAAGLQQRRRTRS